MIVKTEHYIYRIINLKILWLYYTLLYRFLFLGSSALKKKVMIPHV